MAVKGNYCKDHLTIYTLLNHYVIHPKLTKLTIPPKLTHVMSIISQ